MFEIKNVNNKIIYTTNTAASFKEAVQEAVHKGISLNKADLKFQDLSELRIEKADLSESILYRTNFNRSDLSGSNLSLSICDKADFGSAILYKANLSQADFIGANLAYANLFAVNLKDSCLNHSNFYKATLIGADLSEAQCIHTNFCMAQLDSIKLDNAVWTIQIGNTAYLRIDSKEKFTKLYVNDKEVFELNKVFPLDSGPEIINNFIKLLNLS